jgi:hypothetical protein
MGLKVMGMRGISPSVCGGEEEEGLSVGICSLVQSDEKTDSSWVVARYQIYKICRTEIKC